MEDQSKAEKSEVSVETEPERKAPVGEKSKKSKKWWFIGCGCLFLLCLAVVIVGVIGGVGGGLFMGVISKPVGPIKGQLKAINEEDYKKAYEDYCSEEFKEAASYEEFVRIIEDKPEIFESRSSSFTNVSIKGKTAIVSGTITGKDGTVTSMVYKMTQENGEWKIHGFEQGYGDVDEE